MAASPLFDLSGIDLNGVALTPEDVGRLNPQCGHMRQLDYVIWVDETRTSALGVKDVRPDEFWVAGHIPGRPILPGVLMIEAAAQLASVVFKLKQLEVPFLGFTRCDKVAFRGQVVPGQRMYLLAREVMCNARRFVCEVQATVDGTLVFEGQITGMTM